MEVLKNTFLSELIKKRFWERNNRQNTAEETFICEGKRGVVSFQFLFLKSFLHSKKYFFYFLDDKEQSYYATTEIEDFVGAENVLYFPETYKQPYQIEKTQNANNCVTDGSFRGDSQGQWDKKNLIASASALSEKVVKREDFTAITQK